MPVRIIRHFVFQLFAFSRGRRVAGEGAWVDDFISPHSVGHQSQLVETDHYGKLGADYIAEHGCLCRLTLSRLQQ